MKWVYRVLRLFFCPHKYSHLLEKRDIVVGSDNYVKGFIVTKECCYCGKVKSWSVRP